MHLQSSVPSAAAPFGSGCPIAQLGRFRCQPSSLAQRYLARRGRAICPIQCRISSEPLASTFAKMAKAIPGPQEWSRVGAGTWTRIQEGVSGYKPYAALFGVAILWGSYTPALRYLFLSDEPPSAALLNALQACLPAPFLLATGLAAYLANKKPRPVSLSSMSELSMSEMTIDSSNDNSLPLPLSSTAPKTLERASLQAVLLEAEAVSAVVSPRSRIHQNGFMHTCSQALNWRSDSLMVAGAELGMWLFLDYALEVLGVQMISATKAAFLNQATVLITPLLVHLSGESVRRNDWVACSIALVGSILVAVDGLYLCVADGTAPAGGEGTAMGYFFVLMSAVFFALATVRMGRYSSQFSSLDLASASTLSHAVLSLIWVFIDMQGSPHGVMDAESALWKMVSDPTSLAVLTWIGAGPGALAAVLQVAGQQKVAPAQAQVIYATTPIFATGLAMVVLDASDEAMGITAWFGAGLMLLGSLVASVGATEHEAV